jgi:hypothetical protein
MKMLLDHHTATALHSKLKLFTQFGVLCWYYTISHVSEYVPE